jgi:hypothetical protein
MITQEWEKTNITLAAPTTTLVFSGKGVLHSVVINKPLANGSIILYDAITATNAFASIIKPATLLSDAADTIIYDVAIKTGLCIVTSAAAQDITVTWQK